MSVKNIIEKFLIIAKINQCIKMKKIFYLDNAATTQIDKQTIKKINRFLENNYANPSSPHFQGEIVRNMIETARKKISKFMNAEPEEIVFTSGGTESNNLAIFGLTRNSELKDKNHIITSKIEHPSILEPLKELEKKGYRITYLDVNKDGIINLKDLKNSITKKTLLTTIMHVNNEIGAIQPIREIGKICKEKGVLFHSDMVQSFGKIKINVKNMHVDLISVSGHKINSIKGFGFLYVNKKIKPKLNPLLLGGGQEFNLRSGTENTLGVFSFSEAISLARSIEKTMKMRNYLAKEILKIPKTLLNGPKIDSDNRICNNLNLSFYGIEGEALVLLLSKKGIGVSTGSACSSHNLKKSHVLRSIKVPDLYTNGSLRITLDTRKNNQLTKKQADYIIKNIKNSVNKLRKISPFKT